jgi:hypothetical protein
VRTDEPFPFTPQHVLEAKESDRREWVKSLTDIVNLLLINNVGSLSRGDAVYVYDASYDAITYPYWNIYCEDVIALFRANRWRIEYGPLMENKSLSYLFRLPEDLVK